MAARQLASVVGRDIRDDVGRRSRHVARPRARRPGRPRGGGRAPSRRGRTAGPAPAYVDCGAGRDEREPCDRRTRDSVRPATPSAHRSARTRAGRSARAAPRTAEGAGAVAGTPAPQTGAAKPERGDPGATQRTVRRKPCRVCVSSGTNVSRVERVRGDRSGKPSQAAGAVVGLEQLGLVPDVEPLAREPVAVHRLAWVQPGDEASRLVGRVPFREVLVDERQVLARVDVRRDRGERRRRLVRLLDEERDPIRRRRARRRRSAVASSRSPQS